MLSETVAFLSRHRSAAIVLTVSAITTVAVTVSGLATNEDANGAQSPIHEIPKYTPGPYTPTPAPTTPTALPFPLPSPTLLPTPTSTITVVTTPTVPASLVLTTSTATATTTATVTSVPTPTGTITPTPVPTCEERAHGLNPCDKIFFKHPCRCPP